MNEACEEFNFKKQGGVTPKPEDRTLPISVGLFQSTCMCFLSFNFYSKSAGGGGLTLTYSPYLTAERSKVPWLVVRETEPVRCSSLGCRVASPNRPNPHLQMFCSKSAG